MTRLDCVCAMALDTYRTEHACVGSHNWQSQFEAQVLLTKLIQERQNVAISPIQMVANAHKRIVKKLDLRTHQIDKE